MRVPAAVTDDVFTLDSFLFQRRRFLSKRPGFEWSWNLFCSDEILSELDFRLETGPGGVSLRLRYLASGEGDDRRREYGVDLERTSCRRGGRWWFRCPLLVDGGAACGARCRFLYLQRKQQRFACRRCSGLTYSSSRRNHNPVFTGYVQPTEALRKATLGLLRSRSEERRSHFERKVQAARQQIADFSRRWRKIAARVVVGRAGVRDERYFEELVELLLGAAVLRLVEAEFAEPEGTNDASLSSIDRATLCGEMLAGFLDLTTWKGSARILKAARDPGGRCRLVLVSILNHRLLEAAKGHVHGGLAAEKYVEKLAEDPEALLTYVNLMCVKRVDSDRRKREPARDVS